MREYREKRIEVGFERNPKKVFDELDSFVAQLIRAGWNIENTVLDDTMEYIDIIYYREIELTKEESTQ